MQFPDVFLQVKVPAEALAAGGAGEGLLVVVRVHVEGQVVDLVERLAADGALELLLPAVRQLVVLVVPFLVKAFAAELTHEGLVSRVDPRVRVERGAAVKGLSALVALVRLFLSVDDLVAAQRARLTEAFPANFTDEGARAGVHRHVARQVVVRVKHLAAHLAREDFGFVSSARAAEPRGGCGAFEHVVSEDVLALLDVVLDVSVRLSRRKTLRGRLVREQRLVARGQQVRGHWHV